MITSVYGIYKKYNLIKNNTKTELNAKFEKKLLEFKNLDGCSNSYRPVLVAVGSYSEQYDTGHQFTKKI